MKTSIRFAVFVVAIAATAATATDIAAARRPNGGAALEAPAASAAITLVFCAPGYPGSTEEAQPTMDLLAAAINAAAGWTSGELKAVYFETDQGGLDRLKSVDAAVVVSPLAFWLQHRAALGLDPLMHAVEAGGQTVEAWTLVAAAGQVTSSSSLSGFELISLAGYAPRFVRGPALGAWGELPRDVRIVFSNAVLSGLRRASTGAKVAMLLDRAQAAAVPSLPFASKLQVITQSAPLPVTVVASVGNRLPVARRSALVKALASLGSTPSGASALAGVRMARFVAADQSALGRARDAFDRLKE
jgi:hypothetical protein